MGFGQYEKTSSAGSGIEPGLYDATIDDAKVVRKPDGSLFEDDYGKNKVDVKFQTAEGIVSRRFTISFGQNRQSGVYAVFAKFIEAATGIKCGDTGQRQVDEIMLIGKRVRVLVGMNDRGYPTVENVMPAARPSASRQGTSTLQHQAPQVSAFDDSGLPPEPTDDDSVPF